eukprot:evm.model.scf_18.20 EVM.evm.TU.scf_18.20   scf_18:121145-122803(+)
MWRGLVRVTGLGRAGPASATSGQPALLRFCFAVSRLQRTIPSTRACHGAGALLPARHRRIALLDVHNHGQTMVDLTCSLEEHMAVLLMLWSSGQEPALDAPLCYVWSLPAKLCMNCARRLLCAAVIAIAHVPCKAIAVATPVSCTFARKPPDGKAIRHAIRRTLVNSPPQLPATIDRAQNVSVRSSAPERRLCLPWFQGTAATATEKAPETLYRRLGGEAHLQGVIESFYRKVYADGRLSHWFEGFAASKMEGQMGRFFKFCFGEVPTYDGRDLTTAHAGLVRGGLNDGDYDVLVELFTAAFVESGVSEDLVAEVGAIVESARDPVLGRKPEDKP